MILFRKINVGDVRTNVIDINISKCDIFVVLITYDSLQRPHVEKEDLQAQNENKKIIPCIQIEINYADIKWGLNIIQGIEFNDKYDLARKLYSRILKIRKQVKDVTGTKALTLPVPDKLKEEMPQPTNQLKNEYPPLSSSIAKSDASKMSLTKNLYSFYLILETSI
ncbi:MAG TPA: hypothetical protein VJ799_04095 [Nitrososphaeraceae archaeon]|nr:hypothetical protein [Nitrososphaeraceae archaeon]